MPKYPRAANWVGKTSSSKPFRVVLDLPLSHVLLNLIVETISEFHLNSAALGAISLSLIAGLPTLLRQDLCPSLLIHIVIISLAYGYRGADKQSNRHGNSNRPEKYGHWALPLRLTIVYGPPSGNLPPLLRWQGSWRHSKQGSGPELRDVGLRFV